MNDENAKNESTFPPAAESTTNHSMSSSRPFSDNNNNNNNNPAMVVVNKDDLTDTVEQTMETGSEEEQHDQETDLPSSSTNDDGEESPCALLGNNSNKKRTRTDDNDDDDDEAHVENDILQLQKIWEQEQQNEKEDNTHTTNNNKDAIEKTWRLISKVVDDLIQDGIAAHQELERSNQKLKAANNECTTKTREIERLRAAEHKSRESIANLLRAVGSSNEETKDSSHAKLMEAKMRADLLHMTSKRDQAEADLVESIRRNSCLSDDLSEAKAKLSRAQQEKMQIERDQRATLALAKSLQGNNHTELDYYKRRSAELQTQVQGLTAVLSEKNRQIEDIRRQHERSMSQNRLAAYRSGGAGTERKQKQRT